MEVVQFFHFRSRSLGTFVKVDEGESLVGKKVDCRLPGRGPWEKTIYLHGVEVLEQRAAVTSLGETMWGVDVKVVGSDRWIHNADVLRFAN